jgi:small GTP-binding protein
MAEDSEAPSQRPPEFDQLFRDFPNDSRRLMQVVWESLPLSTRNDVVGLLPSMTGNIGRLRKLLELAREQAEMAFGQKQKVTIVGPANVGKSTLYNQLIQEKEDRARVSPIPGTTRANQEADAGLFTIVDTPGADAVGAVGERERQQAVTAAMGSDLLIVMFDAIQGIKRPEQELFKELTGLGKPYIVVLNKMDLVRREGRQAVQHAAESLGLAPEQIIPLAAERGKNLDQLVTAIVKAEPQLVAALCQALPAYRWRLAWRSITGAASTAGIIALTPLPLLDFIPLVAVQSSLVLGIARIYNYKITTSRARELVATFGLGLLGRTLFQELVKLGGPPGWAVAAAVAASTTAVMGYASILWFERGERLTSDTMRRASQNITAYLLESLKGLGRRRPSRRKLEERLSEALAQSPLATDRHALDQQVESSASNPSG